MYVRWDDERIYCSELLRKLCKQAADLELGAIRKVSNLNVQGKVVQALIEKRLGRHTVLPEHEPMVSLPSIWDSSALRTVHTQWLVW